MSATTIERVLKRIVCLFRGHDRLYSALISPGQWGAIPWSCECARCGKALEMK